MAELQVKVEPTTIPPLNNRTGEYDTKWRVYYWAKRPDAEKHAASDQFHWHPDSEHATQELAEKRAAELQGGARKKSMLRT
jgi:hypothetical protein